MSTTTGPEMGKCEGNEGTTRGGLRVAHRGTRGLLR